MLVFRIAGKNGPGIMPTPSHELFTKCRSNDNFALYIISKSMEFKVVISVLQWCLGVIPCSKTSFIQSGWKIGPSCFISFNWKVFAVLGLTEMISEY